MNAKHNMIIYKDKIVKIETVEFCNLKSDYWELKYYNFEKSYRYSKENLEYLENPEEINPSDVVIKKDGVELYNTEEIYIYRGKNKVYWVVYFQNRQYGVYVENEEIEIIYIADTCLGRPKSKKVFEYLKLLSTIEKPENEKYEESYLKRQYEKIKYIDNEVILSDYLKGQLPLDNKKHLLNNDLIFPFGCNNSQLQAVKIAMENRMSVIQGPPGTGKTQTILNIIANILMNGQTVLIASGLNSATENVYEKLKAYHFDFVAAPLGNVENKQQFIDNQGEYPDFSAWRKDISASTEILNNLKIYFDKKEKLAALKQELSQLTIEAKYFGERELLETKIPLSSGQWLRLWNEYQVKIMCHKNFSIWNKILNYWKYGINWIFYKRKPIDIITCFKHGFYITRKRELEEEIQKIEKYIRLNEKLQKQFTEESVQILKNKLAIDYMKKINYCGNEKRRKFEMADLEKIPKEFLNEYPVVLSTTHASGACLRRGTVYDYLILDEASQINIVSGAMAFSVAKNVVIVGDLKQLPHVVNGRLKKEYDRIFENSGLSQPYDYVNNSLLKSVINLMPDIPNTLLREHYRCHPKIINFCNQKFYDGRLIIMTTDNGEKDTLSVYKTKKGNHKRGHYSQRQIDVIKEEVISEYNLDMKEIGIIAPYKEQANKVCLEIEGSDSSTVHKFQGKEKDTIIISTVDDEISEFVDDALIVNVAVSRAQKRLIVVTTGNEQKKSGNITDLCDYIMYNNMQVVESKISSVFDYLYKQYDKERDKFLKEYNLKNLWGKEKVMYDSERLVHSMIVDVFQEECYFELDVLPQYCIRELIIDDSLLNEKERQYIFNNASLDFLIVYKITKRPILAIEVDGWKYHKRGTVQNEKDAMKDEILNKYGIAWLRWTTNGSQEKRELKNKLKILLNTDK